MKIRNGFVSNSSSSSFVVSFPKEPKSAEDVKRMLFDENETHYSGYYSDNLWTIEQVAQTVWKDICDQIKNDYDLILDELKGVSSYDDPEAPDLDDYWEEKKWDLHDIACEKYAKKKINEFFNTRKNKLKKLNNEEYIDNAVYVFEYADDSGSYGSVLEHGDLFKKLKHIKISKH